MGWTLLQGEELEAASKKLGFNMGEGSFAKKFGRKTVFLRDTGSCRMYVPFDRDDPERERSNCGFKMSFRANLIHGEEEYVDNAARYLLQQFYSLPSSRENGHDS